MRTTIISLLLSIGVLAGCTGSPVQKEASDLTVESDGQHALVVPEPLTAPQQQQLSLAQRLADEGHWSQTEQAISALTAERPDVAYLASFMAWVIQQQGREEEARTLYKKALQVNPGELMAVNNLALLLRASGEFAASRDLLVQGLRMNDSAPELHFNLAVLSELYLLDMEAALAHYRAYQSFVADEDQKVTGWIADLERRLR